MKGQQKVRKPSIRRTFSSGFARQLIPSFPVVDLDSTVEFYRLIGFELVRVTGRGEFKRALLRLGEAKLIFRSVEDTASGDSLTSEDKPILHIQVDDILGMYRHVRGKVPLRRDLQNTLFGPVEFSLVDVNGMVLLFSQRGRTGRQGMSNAETE